MVRRDFVKYPNTDFPAEIKILENVAGKEIWRPEATVIIPTFDGFRGGYLSRLIEQLKLQTFQDFEVIIVKGDPRQGRAINKAAEIARGDILITLDDDTRLGSTSVFDSLVSALRQNPQIGMAGVSNLIPRDASWFVRRVMTELPRRDSSLVDKITDSDMAEHPCCAIPKEVFYRVGGEREDIIRGLDPYLRQVIRAAGLRVVVIPHTWIHHLPPSSLRSLLRQFFRNGAFSAWGREVCKETPIEVPDGHISDYKTQRSILFRLFRFAWRIPHSLITFKFIYFFTLWAYMFGYFYGAIVKERAGSEK